MTNGNLTRQDLFGNQLKSQSYELRQDVHQRLRDLAKEFKLTAGETIGVLMDTANMELTGAAMRELRAKKEEARARNLEAKAEPAVLNIAKQLQELSPDKLAEVQALLAKG